MNPQLEVLYENYCPKSRVFLAWAIKNRTDPYLRCDLFESGQCRKDYFCRQLVKKVVIGSWFPNIKEAKLWMKPGTACYAKKIDTGGIIIVTDPDPFLGDWRTNQKNGLFFITKRDIYCSNCAKRKAIEELGICKACLPLFPVVSEKIKEEAQINVV